MALTDLTFQRQDPFDRLYKMASTAYLLQKPELDEQTRQAEMQKLQMQNKQQIMEGNLGLLKTILPKLDDNTVNDVLGALTESDPMYNNIFQIIKDKGISYKTKSGESQLIQDNSGNWLSVNKETRIAEPVISPSGEKVIGKKQGEIENIETKKLAQSIFKDITTSEDFKRSAQMLNTAGEILDKLLPEAEKGNETAIATLKTRIPRALGEVGNLAIQEQIAPLKGVSIERITDFYIKTLAKGTLPEKQIQELKSIFSSIRNFQNKNINSLIQVGKERLSGLDIDQKTIDAFIQPELKRYTYQGYSAGDLTEKISAVGRTKSGLIELSDGRQVSPEDAKKIISGE